ncbi:MAG: hypothetical protein OXH57_06745 [Ekhidna sp.]|nr:hypothetical protein [Ekhidna sp.]
MYGGLYLVARFMKTITFSLLILISTAILAQTKSISIEAGFRYNLPERLYNKNLSKFDEQKSGFGLELMPKWNLSNKHSIGIDLGFNLVAEDATTDNIGAFEVLSFVPTFQQKLFDGKFSPFYNVGLGGYSVLNSQTSIAPGVAISIGTTLFRRVYFSFDYNKILSKINVDEDVINGFDKWYFMSVTLKYDIVIK